MENILVTGATGHLGSVVVSHLLKNVSSNYIKVLARDDKKASFLKEKGLEVRIGTFDDTASMEKALRGVERLLLISTGDPNRLQQHKNVVDAAIEANVGHLIYTGVSMKDAYNAAFKGMETHFQTEDYIKESGLTYTFLRNNLYMDLIPVYAGEKIFEKGIYLPAADGKVPFTLRREMGEAAANVLLQYGHENSIYEISGDELYSYHDVARELSLLSGKTITYTNANAITFSQEMKNAGIPDYMVSIIDGFNADIRQHRYEILSTDLEMLLGRKPLSLKNGLKEIYGL